MVSFSSSSSDSESLAAFLAFFKALISLSAFFLIEAVLDGSSVISF
jgi:hypothetical protein